MTDRVPCSKNLIVNYLPRYVDEALFRDIFAEHGPVQQTKIIREKKTGRSKTFGFVTYVDSASAAEAIRAKNGYVIGNKKLKVGVARLPSESIENRKLVVKGLPLAYTEEDIFNLFSKFGEVIECRLLTNSRSKSRGQCFISYVRGEDCMAAYMELPNMFQGQDRLTIEVYNKDHFTAKQHNQAVVAAATRKAHSPYGYSGTSVIPQAYAPAGVGLLPPPPHPGVSSGHHGAYYDTQRAERPYTTPYIPSHVRSPQLYKPSMQGQRDHERRAVVRYDYDRDYARCRHDQYMYAHPYRHSPYDELHSTREYPPKHEESVGREGGYFYDDYRRELVEQQQQQLHGGDDVTGGGGGDECQRFQTYSYAHDGPITMSSPAPTYPYKYSREVLKNEDYVLPYDRTVSMLVPSQSDTKASDRIIDRPGDHPIQMSADRSVSVDRPTERPPGRSFDRRTDDLETHMNVFNILLSDVPVECGATLIASSFRQYGSVSGVIIHTDTNSEEPVPLGSVEVNIWAHRDSIGDMESLQAQHRFVLTDGTCVTVQSVTRHS